MSVSILILTLNEEANLAACLRALRWSDDIVVLDSGSTDRTREIAASFDVRFQHRAFDDYAAQRNFALNEIAYKHQWLLMVDADEVVSEELAEEIKNAVTNDDDETCLYRMRRKDYLLGRWIKHSSGYPTWFGRLMKIGRVSIERAINEEYVTTGKVGFLKHHLLHYPFNKGFHAWFEKHNRYSTMEAEARVVSLNAHTASSRLWKDVWKNLRAADPTIRRREIKRLVYKLPGRPALMFGALYILRGGFLDGYAGLTFCTLRSFYEYMIDCKTEELNRRRRGLSL